MRLLPIIVVLLSFLPIRQGSAQEVVVSRSDSTAHIEGKTYLIHTVLPRQTLFSVAKAYGVRLTRIAFDNPGVMEGLKQGQVLRILKSAVGETSIDDGSNDLVPRDGFILHTVPAKQTLYSISKAYNTTVSAILDANPKLSEGLKVGAVIRVPVPKSPSAENSGEMSLAELSELMVGVDTIEAGADSVTHSWNVALLLPFYLDMNDTLEARRPPEEDEQIHKRSEMALHFYEGALLAVDSLKRAGYHVNLTVIDTENRPWKVRNLIENGVLKNMQLIIGPFYSNVFSEVAAFAHQHCIPLVSPTIKSNGIVADNPYAFKMIPSEETMVRFIGRYLALSDSTNNLILHYGTEREKQLIDRFNAGLSGSPGNTMVSFTAHDIYAEGTDSIRSLLSSTGRNNVVILSEDQAKLARLLRTMTGWLQDAYIVAFTPSSWQHFKNLEIDHFDQLRIHLPTAFHIDHDQVPVQLFVQKFRAKFASEPNSFAYRGYDLFMHFIPRLSGIEKTGIGTMEGVLDLGLQSDLEWERYLDGGFENVRPCMVDYTDLQLKPAID